MRFAVLFAVLAACGDTVVIESKPEVVVDGNHVADGAAHVHGDACDNGANCKHGAEVAATPSADGAWDHYGAPFAVSDVTAASALLADPQAFVGKTLKVEGQAADVCQKMGCWMIVKDGDKTMRVTMKDHSFGVDKAGAGKTCQIEGELVAKDVVAADEEHIKSEAAHPELQPAVAAGSKTYELVASAVAFKKG